MPNSENLSLNEVYARLRQQPKDVRDRVCRLVLDVLDGKTANKPKAAVTERLSASDAFYPPTGHVKRKGSK